MSVCTHDCKSTARGTDNIKFNHTEFVTAAVPFIASLSMAAVKECPGGSWLHVGHNCRALGAQGYGLDGQENAVRISTRARNLFILHIFQPLLNTYTLLHNK
jgi:hypothetical protein